MTITKTKKILSTLTGVALLLSSSVALAGVAATNHNLSSAGTGPNTFSGTTEICVFCHTPHGSDITASVPLWNRSVPLPATFTTYDSLGTSSLDGAMAQVGSVSVACLSCHDGAQAMDTILNDPGSGAVVASFTAGTWTGADRPAGIALIGTELRDDHPIGIAYAGGATGGDFDVAGSLVDKDFKPATETAVGSDLWFVDTNTNATREKIDIQLYTRTNATATIFAGGGTITGAIPFVECASCHDPHTENTTFLRVTAVGEGNDTSRVCLACHIK
ncbi:MAG: cytochrome c3 family protein [Porticoccus sp.]